jgi:hypothetical protein
MSCEALRPNLGAPSASWQPGHGAGICNFVRSTLKGPCSLLIETLSHLYCTAATRRKQLDRAAWRKSGNKLISCGPSQQQPRSHAAIKGYNRSNRAAGIPIPGCSVSVGQQVPPA